MGGLWGLRAPEGVASPQARAFSWAHFVAGAAGPRGGWGLNNKPGGQEGGWPRRLVAHGCPSPHRSALTEPSTLLVVQVAGCQRRGWWSGRGPEHLAAPHRVLMSLPSQTENSVWSEPRCRSGSSHSLSEWAQAGAGDTSPWKGEAGPTGMPAEAWSLGACPQETGAGVRRGTGPRGPEEAAA